MYDVVSLGSLTRYLQIALHRFTKSYSYESTCSQRISIQFSLKQNLLEVALLVDCHVCLKEGLSISRDSYPLLLLPRYFT
jgi:hypothetical protein